MIYIADISPQADVYTVVDSDTNRSINLSLAELDDLATKGSIAGYSPLGVHYAVTVLDDLVLPKFYLSSGYDYDFIAFPKFNINAPDGGESRYTFSLFDFKTGEEITNTCIIVDITNFPEVTFRDRFGKLHSGAVLFLVGATGDYNLYCNSYHRDDKMISSSPFAVRTYITAHLPFSVILKRTGLLDYWKCCSRLFFKLISAETSLSVVSKYIGEDCEIRYESLNWCNLQKRLSEEDICLDTLLSQYFNVDSNPEDSGHCICAYIFSSFLRYMRSIPKLDDTIAVRCFDELTETFTRKDYPDSRWVYVADLGMFIKTSQEGMLSALTSFYTSLDKLVSTRCWVGYDIAGTISESTAMSIKHRTLDLLSFSKDASFVNYAYRQDGYYTGVFPTVFHFSGAFTHGFSTLDLYKNSDVHERFLSFVLAQRSALVNSLFVYRFIPAYVCDTAIVSSKLVKKNGQLEYALKAVRSRATDICGGTERRSSVARTLWYWHTTTAKSSNVYLTARVQSHISSIVQGSPISSLGEEIPDFKGTLTECLLRLKKWRSLDSYKKDDFIGVLSFATSRGIITFDLDNFIRFSGFSLKDKAQATLVSLARLAGTVPVVVNASGIVTAINVKEDADINNVIFPDVTKVIPFSVLRGVRETRMKKLVLNFSDCKLEKLLMTQAEANSLVSTLAGAEVELVISDNIQLPVLSKLLLNVISYKKFSVFAKSESALKNYICSLWTLSYTNASIMALVCRTFRSSTIIEEMETDTSKAFDTSFDFSVYTGEKVEECMAYGLRFLQPLESKFTKSVFEGVIKFMYSYFNSELSKFNKSPKFIFSGDTAVDAPKSLCSLIYGAHKTHFFDCVTSNNSPCLYSKAALEGAFMGTSLYPVFLQYTILYDFCSYGVYKFGADFVYNTLSQNKIFTLWDRFKNEYNRVWNFAKDVLVYAPNWKTVIRNSSENWFKTHLNG